MLMPVYQGQGPGARVSHGRAYALGALAVCQQAGVSGETTGVAATVSLMEVGAHSRNDADFVDQHEKAAYPQGHRAPAGPQSPPQGRRANGG